MKVLRNNLALVIWDEFTQKRDSWWTSAIFKLRVRGKTSLQQQDCFLFFVALCTVYVFEPGWFSHVSLWNRATFTWSFQPILCAGSVPVCVYKSIVPLISQHSRLGPSRTQSFACLAQEHSHPLTKPPHDTPFSPISYIRAELMAHQLESSASWANLGSV